MALFVAAALSLAHYEATLAELARADDRGLGKQERTTEAPPQTDEA